jgi:hypothetical protein
MATAPKNADHEEIAWQCSVDFPPFRPALSCHPASEPTGSSLCFT